MVSAVILAAGAGKRMGRAKQLLMLGDKPLLWHVAQAACQSQAAEVVVITGAYEEEVRKIMAALPVRLVHNSRWAEGQGSSVAAAAAALSAEAEAVLFLLADQPFINTALINQVIDNYRSSRLDDRCSVIMPCCGEQPGNPVLFKLQRWRQALLALAGEEGARRLIRQCPEEIRRIDVAEKQLFWDADTPEDYRRMQEYWRR